jgi:poly-D-alanine transfer protein DltD
MVNPKNELTILLDQVESELKGAMFIPCPVCEEWMELEGFNKHFSEKNDPPHIVYAVMKS